MSILYTKEFWDLTVISAELKKKLFKRWFMHILEACSNLVAAGCRSFVVCCAQW